MATELQKLIWAKTENADFVSIEDFNNLKSQAEQQNELSTLNFSFRRFVRIGSDPKIEGFYRVKLFGKVNNPITNWEGYLTTGTYFLYELRCVKNFGFEAVNIFHDEKESESPGILLIVIGFIIALYIRLPIGIILTLVNFIIGLFASKKDKQI